MSENSGSDFHVAPYQLNNEGPRHFGQTMQQSREGSSVSFSTAYNEELVRNSNLDPTGAEFYPSNPSTSLYNTNCQQQFQHRNNGRGNRQFGSGRTFTQSKNNYTRSNGRNERNRSGENKNEVTDTSNTSYNNYNRRNEQSRVTADTSQHSAQETTGESSNMQHENYNKNSNNTLSDNPSSSRINYKGNNSGHNRQNNYHRNSNQYNNYRDSRKYNNYDKRRDNMFRNEPSSLPNNGNSYSRFGNSSRMNYEAENYQFDQYKQVSKGEDRNKSYRNETSDLGNVAEDNERPKMNDRGSRKFDNNWRGMPRDAGMSHTKFNKSDSNTSKSWRKNGNNRKDISPRNSNGINKCKYVLFQNSLQKTG